MWIEASGTPPNRSARLSRRVAALAILGSLVAAGAGAAGAADLQVQQILAPTGNPDVDIAGCAGRSARRRL
jgi:hypothetical protein